MTLALAALALLTAHVGSPDIYLDGQAGPYALFVTVRPPQVIPGVAEVEIRAPEGVTGIFIAPAPMTGPGAKFSPTPDRMKPSVADPRFFTGGLWMMGSGSWQVKVRVEGNQGTGYLNVPVPNAAKRTLSMDRTVAIGLFAMMLLLSAGFVSIVRAAARDAQRQPGEAIEPTHRRKAAMGFVVASVIAGLAFWGGRNWWNSEATDYNNYLYKPLGLTAHAANGTLTLDLEHRGWFQAPDLDDLALDHGYPMHLFVVAVPSLDRVWHLHPAMKGNGRFEHALPTMPAGRYRLYADIVHRTGFPETLVAELDLPETRDGKLGPDDSASGPPADGWRMIRVDNQPLKARQAVRLGFALVDAAGHHATDLETYLGMPGHAAVVSKDGSVFAHLHPTGTVPMAALVVATNNPHAGHYMGGALPSTVAFPYGFPKPGEYRMFVQLRRAGRVETGVFDLSVVQ